MSPTQFAETSHQVSLAPPIIRSIGGWMIESFCRRDPRSGPDTWLAIATRGAQFAFGSGLDERTAQARALASAAERQD